MSNYISPWLDDELNILRDAVFQFFSEEFTPHEESWKAQGMVDRSAWLKAGEMGILCPSIPEEYGGAGGTFAHEAVISEKNVTMLSILLKHVTRVFMSKKTSQGFLKSGKTRHKGFDTYSDFDQL